MKNKLVILMLTTASTVFAQQLPNPGFEDWSGATYNGEIQPASWNASNVTQFGLEFNFAHQEMGHTGNYSLRVQDTSIGALGITETSPGYFALGQPWVFIKDITSVNQATAGTSGGISWTSRPDTMAVWIKRTGNNYAREDFHLLFYSWKGTAVGNQYKGKNGNCTSVRQTDEESDIRQATNGNECGTATKATQIAEGWWRERNEYAQWTLIKVPVFYMNDEIPEKCNVIFSASNYPNFRANDGLYDGNSLYVDDVELIYSSKIQHLYIDNKEWRGFDPNTSEEQIYSLGEHATTIPNIFAMRGEGALTNSKNITTHFPGRRLGDNEMTVTQGAIDGQPTVITVRSEDGTSTTTYKIKFVRAASTNTALAGIQVNGEDIKGFNPHTTSYAVELPYGTEQTPVVTVVSQEDAQTVTITQPTGVNGTATIVVTAADQTSTRTYTLTFSTALLSDNELAGIIINGTPLPGFSPQKTMYPSVSLPVETTVMPTVEAVKKYDGQTVTSTVPAVIDGGMYQIAVTTPGNPTPKIYKLIFKLEASSYSRLNDLQIGDSYISNFDPENLTYYVTLPIGTVELPTVTYITGDPYQTVEVTEGGLDGTTRVLVTAGNGVDQTVYKIVVTTLHSEVNWLDGILLDGVPLDGFNRDRTDYSVALPVGTTALPEITVVQGDPYQKVSVIKGGLNGVTRIFVVADDGTGKIYQITFSVEQATDATLNMIYLDGVPLEGFAPEILEYSVRLPKATTALPAITWDKHDDYQTVTARSGGVNGDYRLTVKPQSGASKTYVIHFSVEQNESAALRMIYLDGVPLEDFAPETLDYVYLLPEGVSILPTVTYAKENEAQQVLSVLDNNIQSIRVTAESGKQQTYTVSFVIRKSESALLRMIYLDSVPLEGFMPEQLSYPVVLTGDRCPVITVDKEDGQQVTISAPSGAGQAFIMVTPEMGASNTYTLTLTPAASTAAQLQAIYADGVLLSGFDPAIKNYTLVYQDKEPVITYMADASQTVQQLTHGQEVALYVSAGNEQTVYTVTCTRTPSADCALEAILLDGVLMDGFDAQVLTYDRTLPTGTSIPTVTYVKKDNNQSVFFATGTGTGHGQAHSSITVVAANGNQQTYVVNFAVQPYASSELLDLQVEGMTPAFDPATYRYDVQVESGRSLPDVSLVKDAGQTAMIATLSDTVKQITVAAESGAVSVYEIVFHRVMSSNALLADIVIDGKPLDGFAPDVFVYTDTLPRHTAFVPVIQAKGQASNQTITTCYSRPNGHTTITVTAEDGVTENTYTIAFPMRKSANTALKTVMIENTEFVFYPEQTEYDIVLPRNAKAVPDLMYERDEPEQRITYLSRPLGDTTTITVTAENGDTRVYAFHFYPEQPSEDNVLKLLYITELDKTLDMTDKMQRDFTVTMPYGSRTMTVEYEKNYPEQTVFVQPGGIYRPTVITVHGNRDGETDQVYTITPDVVTENPAVLAELTINNNPLEGFDPQRRSYIVNVESTPIVRYKGVAGSEVNIITQTNKHWQAEVTKDGCTARYDLWFYYVNDVLPNGEFTDWTSCRTVTSAVKPTSWNTIADVLNTHSVFIIGSFTPDKLVTKSGTDAVHLATKYSTPGGGEIPGFITLGTVTGQWGVAGSSNFAVSGGISFHNSPDSLAIRYYCASVQNNNLIQYILTGSAGTKTIEWKDSETRDSYKTVTYNLSDANSAVGDPTLMNIVLDSYYQISGTILSSSPEMYVDWVRFAFNSSLAGLKVNGLDAVKDGNTFSVNLTDAMDTNRPSLLFVGEVDDQAQQVTWNEENEQGVRTALIRNFAEDGTYTDYTLEVNRPLETRSELAGLKINGTEYAAFTPEQHDYVWHLASDCHQLPDVEPVSLSSLQTVTTVYADSLLTITVQPEEGETTIYTVRFVTDLSDDATLAVLMAEGLTPQFDPSITEYTVTAATMPEVTFVKQSDGQTVLLDKDLSIRVTAENGAEQTYRIAWLQPQEITSGQLDEIALDGNLLSDFAPDKYDYVKPQPVTSSFVRSDAADSVVYIQHPDRLEWHVFGSENHVYTVTYPIELSSDTRLSALWVDGVPYADFNPLITDYTLVSDTVFDLVPVAAHKGQTLAVNAEKEGAALRYTVQVTAEDGVQQCQYTFVVVPDWSEDAALENILMDGQPLQGFRPDSLSYTVVLPTPDIKTAEPKIPSFMFVNKNGQQVETVVNGMLDAASFVQVTSETGTVMRQYELTVTAEPSHNADLSGIIVNGVPVDHFEVGRRYYSVQTDIHHVTVEYASEDRFQNVTVTQNGNIYTLNVMAQDGVTMRDYQVEVYDAKKSDLALLSSILLDGVPMNRFMSEINPDLVFSPLQNRYTVNLPAGTTVLPDVSASMMTADQHVTIRRTETEVMLDVVAADGVSTNTYTLRFAVPLSSNANLKMIYLSNNPLKDFEPDYYYYRITLAGDIHELPEIFVQKGENSQTVSEPLVKGTDVSITVTAENGTQKTYMLMFTFMPSDADTLQMMYVDNRPMEGFSPHKWYYEFLLPVGTTSFPEISWDAADTWQTVTPDTVLNTAKSWVGQYIVVAGNGRKNTYTVAFDIQDSQVDTLQMIYINNRPLDGFDAHQTEYIYTLDAKATELPEVFYVAGDTYQSVMVREVPDATMPKSLGKKIEVEVKAQSGAVRVYSLHFPLAYSSETQLNMIWCGGKNLPNYEEGVSFYKVTLPYGTTQLPVITVTKKEEVQKVDIYVSNDSLVDIQVLAEDREHFGTYTIVFTTALSPDSTLESILLDGVEIDEYDRNRKDYALMVEKGSAVPQLTYLSQPGQQVMLSVCDTVTGGTHTVTYQLDVLSADREHSMGYVVEVVYAKSAVADLQSLLVKGKPVTCADGFSADFHPDSVLYVMEYPIGTQPSQLFTDKDVSWITADTCAKAEVSMIGGANPVIYVTVVAEDGEHYRTYELRQIIRKSSDNTVTMIYLDGKPLADYDPEIHEYEYQLFAGLTAPEVTFEVADTFATAYPVTPGTINNQPWIVTCEAQDGSVNKYEIRFVYSDLNTADKPYEGDVLVQRIPGSTQVAVATLRKNVAAGFYDNTGHLLFYQKIAECDPNNVIVEKDGNNHDRLVRVKDVSECTIIELQPQRVYFYVFFENNKIKISSGKMVIVP